MLVMPVMPAIRIMHLMTKTMFAAADDVADDDDDVDVDMYDYDGCIFLLEYC